MEKMEEEDQSTIAFRHEDGNLYRLIAPVNYTKDQTQVALEWLLGSLKRIYYSGFTGFEIKIPMPKSFQVEDTYFQVELCEEVESEAGG